MARPPHMSLLSVSVQYYGAVIQCFRVSKNCFFPKPKVDSAVIIMTLHGGVYEDEEHFFRVVRAGFKNKRKMLVNTLCDGLNIPKEKILACMSTLSLSKTARAQELTLDQWKELACKILVNLKIENWELKIHLHTKIFDVGVNFMFLFLL